MIIVSDQQQVVAFAAAKEIRENLLFYWPKGSRSAKVQLSSELVRKCWDASPEGSDKVLHKAMEMIQCYEFMAFLNLDESGEYTVRGFLRNN